VQHLLEVTAGVDSQMIGETEILGQVKNAYAAAQARGTTGPVLNRVFQKSFQAAKHVRTHTAIGEGQISVASVAVDLALKIFGDLQPCMSWSGSGQHRREDRRAFKSRGAGRMTVASRRLEHAQEIARAFSAQAAPFESVADTLSEFDIAVCSTAAPGPVVTSAMAASAIRRRAARPLFFIDLAIPRNIEPQSPTCPTFSSTTSMISPNRRGKPRAARDRDPPGPGVACQQGRRALAAGGTRIGGNHTSGSFGAPELRNILRTGQVFRQLHSRSRNRSVHGSPRQPADDWRIRPMAPVS